LANKISICLAFRNGELFLKQQVDSILPQLSFDDELICSDDGSTDSSLEILKSFNDNRIKIIQSPATNNHVKNFESALAYCTGDLIFLSDQDDVWEHNKVELTKLHLQHYDLVISDCSLIDEKNNELASSMFKIQKSKSGILKNLIKNTYMGCCMAFKRSVLEKALPFPAHLKAHDQWIGLIAERYFNVLFLPQPLVKYRKHENNFTQTGKKSRLSRLEQFSYRITLIKHLTLNR